VPSAGWPETGVTNSPASTELHPRDPQADHSRAIRIGGLSCLFASQASDPAADLTPCVPSVRY
jgi:hypothetical protein